MTASVPDPDAAFVDELLRTAAAELDDPRIRIAHVHHAGPPPAAAEPDEAVGQATSATAWRDVRELAEEFTSLWRHAWLSDTTPTHAELRFTAPGSGPARPVLRARAPRSGTVSAEQITDRLLVRGWITDEHSTEPGPIRASRGACTLLVTLGRDDIHVELTGPAFPDGTLTPHAPLTVELTTD
ncbi:hypothetical protein ACWDTI_05505 [Gordonia sp. NPDC003424]